MGGVLDMSGLLEQYKSELPNLWAWLGTTNMYWDRDPIDGTLWAIEGKRAVTNRINTFIRKSFLPCVLQDNLRLSHLRRKWPYRSLQL